MLDVICDVSIHAFRGEGDFGARHFGYPAVVSIHAFRGEGDVSATVGASFTPRFNPRLPGGRRRATQGEAQSSKVVSIHAFRGEGDIIDKQVL